MSETTPVLIGMSGSLRAGSYSNAVLATLREKLAGRASLRLYDLAPIPPDLAIPMQGPTRPSGSGARAGGDRDRQGSGRGGGAMAGGMGMGGGAMAGGMGLGADPAADDPTSSSRTP